MFPMGKAAWKSSPSSCVAVCITASDEAQKFPARLIKRSCRMRLTIPGSCFSHEDIATPPLLPVLAYASTTHRRGYLVCMREGRHQTPLSLSCSCQTNCQASNQAGVETRPNWFAREALLTHLQYLPKGASTRDGWSVTYPTTNLSTRHPQALSAIDRQPYHPTLVRS